MRSHMESLGAIIIVGGKSRRMGRDKRTLSIDGKPLVSFAIELAEHFTSNIVISANDQLPEFKNYPVITDSEPGLGPAMALQNSLKAVTFDKALVLVGDMPFVSKEVIEQLLEAHRDEDQVHFRSEEIIIPFPSLFKTKSKSIIEKIIREGTRSMKGLLSSPQLRSTSIALSKPGRTFTNINEQKDLDRAMKDYWES